MTTGALVCQWCLAGALAAAAGEAPPPPLRPHLADLRGLSQDRLAEVLRAISPEDLVAIGREGVRALGIYRARVIKQERVGGTMHPAQTLEIVVRPSPRTVRLEYVAGPKSGRRVLWRQDQRPSEMLVREGGILGLASLWIDIDGKLAHRDTNHRASELGFGPLLDIFESDLRKGRAQGGHARRDRGLDGRGAYCMEYTAPPGSKGLYAERTLICTDPRLGLPLRIEVFDRQGLLERYEYSDIRPNQQPDKALFEDV
jgi:hypothetical protein